MFCIIHLSFFAENIEFTKSCFIKVVIKFIRFNRIIEIKTKKR